MKAIGLLSLAVLALTACSSGSSGNSGNNASPAQEDNKPVLDNKVSEVKVGIYPLGANHSVLVRKSKQGQLEGIVYPADLEIKISTEYDVKRKIRSLSTPSAKSDVAGCNYLYQYAKSELRAGADYEALSSQLYKDISSATIYGDFKLDWEIQKIFKENNKEEQLKDLKVRGLQKDDIQGTFVAIRFHDSLSELFRDNSNRLQSLKSFSGSVFGYCDILLGKSEYEVAMDESGSSQSKIRLKFSEFKSYW